MHMMIWDRKAFKKYAWNVKFSSISSMWNVSALLLCPCEQLTAEG